MTNILGLIPARGGSKGIPKKNIIPLNGKPLLSYTCEAALRSSHLKRILLSTDSEEIAEVGVKNGVEAPFLRPESISGDNTPSIDVVLHVLDWLQTNERWQPDAVVLLQPTSPLRSATHIDEAVELFIEQSADTVVSVIPVPHRFNPLSIMKSEQGMLHDFLKPDGSFDKYRRQDLPELFARNGPAVLITKTEVLKGERGFYGDRVFPYKMEGKHSIDIDEPFDLQMAEFLLKTMRGEG